MTRSPGPTTDGRSARRHRNRDAVLDAVHELFVETEGAPTVEEVAARSGVSLRSVYRYFPDRQELLRAALTRRVQVAEPLFVLPHAGEGPLGERIEQFVDHRLELYELIAPTARVAMSERGRELGLSGIIERRRRQARDQVREQFAAELAALPAPEGEDLETAIDVLCQFESLELLRVGWSLSPAHTRRVLLTGVRGLLSHSSD